MASLCKATRGASGNLFDHYERKENIKFKNQDIDKNRTYLNYNLAPNKNLNQREILNKRLSEIKVLKRDDVNVTCNWVITLPKNIKENSEEEKLFFKESYNFLKNRYGEKNIISAYVHKDEVTPHMHFCFIPVVIDKKKNIEKVSAFELITKKELNSFHKELNNYMINIFNRDIGILNGATVNGNKTVLELKNEKIENKIRILEENLQSKENKLEDLKKNLEFQENRIKLYQELEKTYEDDIKKYRELTYVMERNINEIESFVKTKELTKERIIDIKQNIKKFKEEKQKLINMINLKKRSYLKYSIEMEEEKLNDNLYRLKHQEKEIKSIQARIENKLIETNQNLQKNNKKRGFKL